MWYTPDIQVDMIMIQPSQDYLDHSYLIQDTY